MINPRWAWFWSMKSLYPWVVLEEMEGMTLLSFTSEPEEEGESALTNMWPLLVYLHLIWKLRGKISFRCSSIPNIEEGGWLCRWLLDYVAEGFKLLFLIHNGPTEDKNHNFSGWSRICILSAHSSLLDKQHSNLNL